MVQKQQIQTTNSPTSISRLERINLGFEYDKTLQQVKHEMHVRTSY